MGVAKKKDHKKKDKRKKGKDGDAKAKGSNPRAFAFQSALKAKAQQGRSAEKAQRRLHGGWVVLLQGSWDAVCCPLL